MRVTRDSPEKAQTVLGKDRNEEKARGKDAEAKRGTEGEQATDGTGRSGWVAQPVPTGVVLSRLAWAKSVYTTSRCSYCGTVEVYCTLLSPTRPGRPTGLCWWCVSDEYSPRRLGRMWVHRQYLQVRTTQGVR
jgi:hypothetical protein